MTWVVAGGGEVCGGAGYPDDFCIFHGPNTAAGWRSGNGLVLVNDRPHSDPPAAQSGRIWNVNSAFYDDNFGAMYIIANRSSVSNTNGVADESDFVIGESFDQGLTISWTPLLQDGIDGSSIPECGTPTPPQRCWIHRLSVVPNPSKPFRWSGVMTYGHRITPIEVDYTQNPPVVRLLDTGGSWTTLQLGKAVDWYPPYISSEQGVFGTASFANHGSGWRLEVWANGSAGSGDGDPSDGPCGITAQQCAEANPPIYCSNRTHPKQVGNVRPRYMLLDPIDLTPLTSWIFPTSSVQGLIYPTDYKAYNWNIFAWDKGTVPILYQGNEDLFICDHSVIFHPQAGAGISSHLLQFQ